MLRRISFVIFLVLAASVSFSMESTGTPLQDNGLLPLQHQTSKPARIHRRPFIWEDKIAKLPKIYGEKTQSSPKKRSGHGGNNYKKKHR